MTREGVSEVDGGDSVLGVEGKRSLSSQRPDAEELGNGVEHHLLLLLYVLDIILHIYNLKNIIRILEEISSFLTRNAPLENVTKNWAGPSPPHLNKIQKNSSFSS